MNYTRFVVRLGLYLEVTLVVKYYSKLMYVNCFDVYVWCRSGVKFWPRPIEGRW